MNRKEFFEKEIKEFFEVILEEIESGVDLEYLQNRYDFSKFLRETEERFIYEKSLADENF